MFNLLKRFIKKIISLFRKPYVHKTDKKLTITVNEPSLTRCHCNPVLSPRSYDWEAEGVFNPAAINVGGRIHLLYRASGRGGQSVFGYASSPDGINFDERLPYPVYIPKEVFEPVSSVGKENQIFDTEMYTSGGTWIGCEDPKLTKIGDRIYLTYVAFAGWDSVRVTMSSISVKDFLNHNWKWTTPILCSEPGVVSKSGGLFPEKINGKYVMFHRVFPSIYMDFLDDLKFKGDKFLKETNPITTGKKGNWDGGKISFGAPPLKTKDGWLVITHAVGGKQEEGGDLRYRIGVMLLDLEDPTKIIYRSPEPVMEPDLWYENDWKPGILYPCGAVIKDGTLLVYYGGGDKYTCVATAPLDIFLNQIKNHKRPKLSINKK